MLLALALACAPPAPTLDGEGGDAWTLERVVTGTAGADCDEVLVTSSRGETVADAADAIDDVQTADGLQTFRAVVPVSPGREDLRAVCVRGRRRSESEPQTWDVRATDGPTARVRLLVQDDGTVLLDAGASTTSSRGTPIVAWSWSADFLAPPGDGDGDGDGNGNGDTADGGDPADAGAIDGETADVTVPEGEHVVRLHVTDADGATDDAAARVVVTDGWPTVPDPLRTHPAWVDDAVVYGVAPYFFGPGGTLADVDAALDGIAALGANVLWLSPVADSPDDDFGYAVTDPFDVAPRFGTDDDLRALVDHAHSLGMHVVLDVVANHTSDQHPYYVSASTDPDSPYRDFYDRDEDGDVTHYFDWTNLPNVDYDDPDVPAYEIASFERWLADGVDGFRADAAWGVQARAPEFWPRWREEIVRRDPDVLLIAEASARDGWWFDHGFDVAYDWTDEPGVPAWQSAWDAETPEKTVYRLQLALDGDAYADDAVALRFLDDNDTGERFVTRYGADHVPVAAALLMTVPGVPALYTGDEVGAEFEPYDEPVVDREDDPHGLRDVWTKLIGLRHELPALRTRTLYGVRTDDPAVLAYVRPGDTHQDDVLVLLNFADDERTVHVRLTDDLAKITNGGRLKDLWTGETLDCGDGLVVATVAGLTPRILTP